MYLLRVLALLAIISLWSPLALAECETVAECAQEAAESAAAAHMALMRSIPSGAVVAFDLENCPAGWTEYQRAYGRFVRGVDRGDPKTDPDGERKPGSYQEDMLKSHTHTAQAPRHYGAAAGDHARAKPDASQTTGASGGIEGRPKNVALLYCRRN